MFIFGISSLQFHKRLVKDDGVRKSNWANYPLNESQKLYAATDAYVSWFRFK